MVPPPQGACSEAAGAEVGYSSTAAENNKDYASTKSFSRANFHFQQLRENVATFDKGNLDGG